MCMLHNSSTAIGFRVYDPRYILLPSLCSCMVQRPGEGLVLGFATGFRVRDPHHATAAVLVLVHGGEAGRGLAARLHRRRGLAALLGVLVAVGRRAHRRQLPHMLAHAAEEADHADAQLHDRTYGSSGPPHASLGNLHRWERPYFKLRLQENATSTKNLPQSTHLDERALSYGVT